MEGNMMQVDASEVVNKDVISHFMLPLAYCREEELRKWFLSMESTLFRYRFQLETPEAQRALLVEFDLPYKAVSSAEYESIKDKLNQVVRSIGQSLSTADTIYYKVVSLLMTQHRSHLSKALVLTNSWHAH